MSRIYSIISIVIFQDDPDLISIPLHIPVLLYKSGVQGGIYCRDMFS